MKVKNEAEPGRLSTDGWSLQQHVPSQQPVAVSADCLGRPTSAGSIPGQSRRNWSELERVEYTIAIVTHNMQQAARVSDYTPTCISGELVEFGLTDEIFIQPGRPRTTSPGGLAVGDGALLSLARRGWLQPRLTTWRAR